MVHAVPVPVPLHVPRPSRSLQTIPKLHSSLSTLHSYLGAVESRAVFFARSIRLVLLSIFPRLFMSGVSFLTLVPSAPTGCAFPPAIGAAAGIITACAAAGSISPACVSPCRIVVPCSRSTIAASFAASC